MCKQEFLDRLSARLSGLPRQDVDEHLAFYAEMIDDRIEEGLSEEAAVAAIGSVETVASQIIADVPLIKLAKEKMKSKRRLRAWEIVLLVLGSPIWLSLAIAAFAVIFSLYVVLWSVIISVWSIFVSMIACSFAGITAGIGFVCFESPVAGIAMIGAGIACAGLSVFLFFGCRASTKGTVILTKKIACGIKKCVVGKETYHA